MDFVQGLDLDISADGRLVVFAARHGETQQLMLRALDSTTWQPLPGTNEGYSPFFSPDGKSIGFFARGKLRTISISSLATREIATTPIGRGGWWADDGFLYFVPGNTSGVMKVPSGGGTPVAVTTLDRAKGPKGVCAFVVERGFPGFSERPIRDKLAFRPAQVGELVFEDCRVPTANLVGREGEGLRVALCAVDATAGTVPVQVVFELAGTADAVDSPAVIVAPDESTRCTSMT